MPIDASRVFVTGADGFIGRHLCARLERRGFRVTRAVRAASADGDNLNFAVTGDLADCDRLERLVAGHDAIAHLAGRAHVLRDRAADPRAEFRRANVDAALRLAQAAVASGVRRFVFVSSIGVLGDRSDHVLTEDDPPAPAGPYAESKLAAERALTGLAAQVPLEVVILRPTLVYGPN